MNIAWFLTRAARIAALLLLVACDAVLAQSVSVRDFLKHKDDWPGWAREERRVMIHGRFHGRAADTVRLDKLDLPCRLSSLVKLPDRLKAGQRLELQGRLLEDDGKIVLQISRLVARDTDADHLSKQAAEVPDDDADQLLMLAAGYVSDAEFYADKPLTEVITAMRAQAVEIKRRAAKGDVGLLRDVRELAISLQLDPRIIDLTDFELLFSRWKMSNPDLSGILKDLRAANRGFDRQVPEPPERLATNFSRDAVRLYAAGSDDDRQWLHRLLFQAVRLQEIQSQLNPDGSNGMLLAALIRREFPAKSSIADELEAREVKWRLSRVPQLNRREMKELYDLLLSQNRQENASSLLRDWLSAQELRFSSQSIADLLRSADEYLFVAEFSRSPEFRDKGIDLLKQAWQKSTTDSPDDATLIAERLKSLGWDRRSDRWVTLEELQQMPQDDVAAAATEGRIVPGMTPEQVVQTLGQPGRIHRIGSATSLRELWVYEGAVGLVVRFRRPVTGGPRDRVVEEISRISGRRP